MKSLATADAGFRETIVAGESVVRVMVISYLTVERHLTALQEAMVAAAAKVQLLPVSAQTKS
jgi:hypothetical protein